MKILVGNSSGILGKKLATILNLEPINPVIDRYSDGEIKIAIPESLYGHEVVIAQSILSPINDRLMELFLLVEASKRAGASRITVVLPYMPYSRQDRQSTEFSPISASLIANFLEVSGVNRLITVDLHSRQIEGFFRACQIYNLESSRVFASSLINKQDCVIVSPDIGGVIRARKICDLLDANLAVINKVRDPASGGLSMMQVIGDVRGKECVIIDDIIDSALTICKAADLLAEQGATKVSAYVTHGVLSANATQLVQASFIDKIFISDSIDHQDLPNKFSIISLAEAISNTI
jgi:ribose-phosphate pyrophosphokinase